MRVLDLFSGLGGWSKAFKERNHDVITIDIEESFKPDIICDVKDITSFPNVDILLSSPPCQEFSKLGLPQGWNHGWTPIL